MLPPSNDIKDIQQYFSSSQEKNKVLKNILGQEPVSLIVAFGTAGCPDKISYNGSVVVGSNVFIHDGHKETEPNEYSRLREKDFFEKIIYPANTSYINDLLNKINIELSNPNYQEFFTKRLLNLPLNPSIPRIYVNANYTALSIVNVTNYKEYALKDEEGIDVYKKSKIAEKLFSVETTHGLIRMISNNVPFIFVSAISDVVGNFETEMFPKQEAQNYSASFNGGVFLSWFINFLFEEKQ